MKINGQDYVLHVELGGESWDFDSAQLSLGQMETLEDEYLALTGNEEYASVTVWMNHVLKERARALQLLIWWLQGRKVPPGKVELDRVGSSLTLELLPKEPASEGGGGSKPNGSVRSLPTTPASAAPRASTA